MPFGRKGVSGAKGRQSKRPCQARYNGEQRAEKNKARRMLRHIKTQPRDMQARGLFQTAFGRLAPVPLE